MQINSIIYKTKKSLDLLKPKFYKLKLSSNFLKFA